VLRRIFGLKRNEATGWRKLHNEEIHNLYSSPSRVRMIRSRRMRWSGNLVWARVKRNAYKILFGKPERMILLVGGRIILKRILC
jgi:hypothetical protein